MLTLIVSKSEITAAQHQLAESLRSLASGPHRITMTHPQGQSDGDAWYFHEENAWICLHPDTDLKRYWNPCGTGTPSPEGVHDIAIEVNPPFVGLNGRVQGAYARKPDGEVVLVHRGRVGGTFIGSGRDAFWAHAGFTSVPMTSAGRTKPVVVVGRISGVDLGRDLGRYVRAAVAFKDHLREIRKRDRK